MNFYKHHIGDYAQATGHLTFIEDAAYSRLIRKYYAEEKPLPAEIKSVQRLVGARTREEKSAVVTVLEEFFILEADGWHNKRCDEELAKWKLQAEANRRVALEREANKSKKGRNESSTNREPIVNESLNESLNESFQSREPNQNPESRIQNPEPKDQNTYVPDKSATTSCPHQEIIDAYHELCPTMDRVKSWTDLRRKFLQSRWRESPKHQSVEFWRKYFTYANQSPFLRGDDNKFRADLEWLIRPSNFVKVIEGKYHNRGAA